MNTESGLPGHSINEGYPFDKIVTMEAMPHRMDCIQDAEGRVIVNWNAAVFGKHESSEELKDFLIHRLFDYSEALKIAEDQIRSLLDEMPFIPEEFNFELIHSPGDIRDDSPVRVYQSKFSPEYSLYREPSDPNDVNWDTSRWIMLKKKGDNAFENIPVNLPCHRIAYALFYAMGIKIKERSDTGIQTITADPEAPRKSTDELLQEAGMLDTGQHEGSRPEAPTASPAVEKDGGFTVEVPFDVVYNRPGQHPSVSYPKIMALDEKDAITKAKFLVETGENADPGHVAEFEHFIATKSE